MYQLSKPACARPRFRTRSSWPVLLAALMLLPLQAAAQDGNRSPERWQQTAREIFEELVEINTTHSTGSTTEAAEAVRRRLLAARALRRRMWW